MDPQSLFFGTLGIFGMITAYDYYVKGKKRINNAEETKYVDVKESYAPLSYNQLKKTYTTTVEVTKNDQTMKETAALPTYAPLDGIMQIGYNNERSVMKQNISNDVAESGVIQDIHTPNQYVLVEPAAVKRRRSNYLPPTTLSESDVVREHD